MSPVTASSLRASVIVCTHNPRRTYLQATLDALRRQSLSVCDWELFVIDNASTEPVADWLDLAWHPKARVIRENELGLTHARLRGIKESHADLLVFVDDDNVLAVDYLEAALEISKRCPPLGIWSGRIDLEFEMTPPPWTRKYWTFLVERQVERDETTREMQLEEPLPVGAGMCVRREVALTYLNEAKHSELRTSLDRCGVNLASSGDTDMAMLACAHGWQRGVFKSLRLRHLIPPERLREDYLIRLTEGIQFSVFVVKRLHGIHVVPPRINAWWHLKYFCDLATKFGRKRRFFQAAKRAQRRTRELYDELSLAKVAKVGADSDAAGSSASS